MPDTARPDTLSGIRRAHSMPFGAEVGDDGVDFRLWAPKYDRIGLRVDGRVEPMEADGGWHRLLVPSAKPGTRYSFVLPDGTEVPDPASRYQPEDVHGPSEVVDPRSYEWSESSWSGRPWEEFVLYELHVGAFTQEGTFRAAIERLDALRDLGVTAIELMPVADFAGRWNWGYDGTLLFAPDATYGRPEDLKALVEAAHDRGIAVILDVIYNHFGPDGNYLPLYAPIFTETHHTPWGAAVNFDASGSDVVRSLFVQNALYWIVEFGLDGLRLDAVHAIIDESQTHILEEIAAVREAVGDRSVHLILENHSNQASWLERDPAGAPLLFTAQWNDDVHHVLHAAATGETVGYYGDYASDTAKLGRSLAEGFVFQGETMASLGAPRGEPSSHLPPTAFVSFIQNHDQIGNRAFGERLTAIAPDDACRAVAAVYLLAPQIPMLFMGEEWDAPQPFPFFCDFGPELAEAVRKGRRAEFSAFHDPEQLAHIPDPLLEETFRSAKLVWEDALAGRGAGSLAWYRQILAVRHAEIVPRLPQIGASARHETLEDAAVRVEWTLRDQSRLILIANLKGSSSEKIAVPEGRRLWCEGPTPGGCLGPWSVVWSLLR